MTPGAALSSDHVNYLIFRYLQEAGHENTATAFYRDWHRGPEYRDPEDYPFAPVVRRNELVSIIQSGLHHDELESRVKKNERRFQFTHANSREGSERQHGAASVFENGSRPSSSAKWKGRPSIVRPTEDFPTPAPKRQRRSEGSEGVHLNGDAMELDAASASAEAEEDAEAVSPAVASEMEVSEILPERYDSMDVAVQTEVKTGPKTSTMYWKVDKPGAVIYHSVFNPDSDGGRGNTLLAVGEGLGRFYQVPDDFGSTKQVSSIDEPSISANSVVTASTWHPKGHAAAFAVDTIRELPGSKQTSQQTIFSHDCNDGSSVQYLVPPLLEPPGITLVLRYDPEGRKLLVLRTNLKRGLVLVYDTQGLEDEKHRPIAWLISEHPILDIAWVKQDAFLICGENGLVELVFLDTNTDLSLKPLNHPIQRHGLLESAPVKFSEGDLQRNYDKVRVSPASTLAILASIQGRKLVVLRNSASGSQSEFRYAQRVNFPEQLTAIAFQPAPNGGPQDPVLIAVTSEEGNCHLYRHAVFPEKEAEARIGLMHRLKLKNGPALALAWSPSGSHLAVAGVDFVQIWETSGLVRREGGHQIEKIEGPANALLTWRPDSGALAARNGEHEDDAARALVEPSLSWSADGETLGFAVERQVAVIKFRPPLGQKEVVGDAVNGHASP